MLDPQENIKVSGNAEFYTTGVPNYVTFGKIIYFVCVKDCILVQRPSRNGVGE